MDDIHRNHRDYAADRRPGEPLDRFVGRLRLELAIYEREDATERRRRTRHNETGQRSMNGARSFARAIRLQESRTEWRRRVLGLDPRLGLLPGFAGE